MYVVNNFSSRVVHYLLELLFFPVWYYVFSLKFWFKSGWHLFLMIFDMLGLGPVLRHLLSPFRQDHTFVGYLMGIIVRLFWSVASLVILTVTTGIIFFVLGMFYFAPWLIFHYGSPLLLYEYVLVWLVIYLVIKQREAYWQRVRRGIVTSGLRKKIWQRLELNHREVERAYFGGEEELVKYLHRHDLNEDDFRACKSWVLRREYRKQAWKYWRDEFFVRRQGVNVGWFAGFLPELKRFSVDLTEAAAEGHLPHIYGREKELSRLLVTLSRPAKNNVLLVGPAGVGKTSMMYAIAWLILGRRVGINLPGVDDLIAPLKGRRVIELNTAGLVGTVGATRSNLEARFNEVLRELKEGHTVLFVSQVENLIQAGLTGYLTPLLAATRFPIVATATPVVMRDILTKMPEFTSEFEVIRLEPPGISETVKILQGVANEVESTQRVFFTYPALSAAAELSERYIHDAVLPDKAIKVLMKAVEVADRRQIGVAEVSAAITAISGVPVGELTAQETNKLLNLERLLSARIIGQKSPIRAIARAMRRSRTQVGSNERPIAAFLFLGPTGVGKTLTAKTLAQVYFTPIGGNNISDAELDQMVEKNFIRFDMSEFAEYGSIDKFTVRMVEQVRAKPFALILLDEFEKAETLIHNLFLQVFEDGQLSSADGEVADFRNCIIIATSNAVTSLPEAESDASQEGEITDNVRRQLEDHFRPELVNRFDGIVFFAPLLPDEMRKVVHLELSKLAKRLKIEYQIKLSWTVGLINELAKLGFDEEYGARPLRRIIQDHLEDRLAQMLLRKELQYGDDYQLDTNDLQG